MISAEERVTPFKCLYDTHAHLCSESFSSDLEAVLESASRKGVAAVVAVGETHADAVRNLGLAAEHSMVRPAAGLYPTVLDEAEADSLEQLIRENRDRLIAVSEVGLDHWKIQDPESREVQEALFRRFVRLAIELDLPLNVHSRSAARRTLEVLLEEGASRVQMHAFDGRAVKAEPGLEAGYYFSVPAAVVRSRQLQKLVRRVPLERLLLETDSPVMAPEPGQRNVPSNVLVSLRTVSQLKEVTELEVAEATSLNAERLYGPGLGPQTGCDP